MSTTPSIIQKLIEAFSNLPGIGPKTAQRLVYHLVNQPESAVKEFGQSLQALPDAVIRCGVCQNIAETDPCVICGDPKRSGGVICVVSSPQDVVSLEKITEYQGVYHVLGGVIDPLEGITPEQLTVAALIARAKKGSVHEIILALNPDMPGETTMLYLTKLLKSYTTIKITRLARGLPIGSDLQYADEVTLSDALKGRREM